MIESASRLAFANLSTSSEVSVFRRYGFERKDTAERTRWHMLLPLGQREVMEIPTVSRTDQGSTISLVSDERIYDLDRLSSIAKATESLFEAQEARGARAKGLPVSYMHAIEMRLQGSATEETLERAGTIVGVHLCDGSDGYPAGLYACIEWTPKAWGEINDGSWHDLSIALATDYRLADGSSIEGECMFAAALVDVGFFEAIPSARDGLPISAFASPGEETISAYRRGITRRFHARQSMNVNLRLDETMLEQMKALISESLAPHSDRLAAIEDRLAKVVAMQEEDLAMDRALLEGEKAEAAEESSEESDEMEMKGATATVTMNRASASEEIAARVAAKVAPLSEARLAELVQQQVESGRLLPAHVRAYALALANGDRLGADSLLGDFTGLASRSGSFSAASVRSASNNPETISASEIVDSLVSEGRYRRGTREFVSEMYNRINIARDSGRLR